MLQKNNHTLACLAGVVAVLGVGSYLLHRKILKCRLREQARRLSMDDYDDYGNEEDDDYIKSLLLDIDGEDFDE